MKPPNRRKWRKSAWVTYISSKKYLNCVVAEENRASDVFYARINADRASQYNSGRTDQLAPGFDYINWKPYGCKRRNDTVRGLLCSVTYTDQNISIKEEQTLTLFQGQVFFSL